MAYLNGWVEEIYLNRRLEVIQFWEITLFFFFYYSSTIRVDIGIWSYSAVSHTDTVVRMKKNSVIKLLFVYHKGIPLMMMADVINVFMRRLG